MCLTINMVQYVRKPVKFNYLHLDFKLGAFRVERHLLIQQGLISTLENQLNLRLN